MSQRGWATTGKLLFGIFVVLLVIAGAALVFVIRNGVSARSSPTATEAMFARTMRHFAIPASARTLRNPLPLTPEMKRMNPTSPHERQEQKEEEEFLEGAHRNESH